MSRKSIRDAEHFRGYGAICGHLPERRVNRVKGHVRGGRYQTLHGSHPIQFFLCDQKPHEFVGHIQIIAILVDGKLHGRAVDKIAAFLRHGDRGKRVIKRRVDEGLRLALPFPCPGHGIPGADHHRHVAFKKAKDHLGIVVFDLIARIEVNTAVSDQLLHRFQGRTHGFSRGGIQINGKRKRVRIIGKRGDKQRISNRVHKAAGRFETVAHHWAGIAFVAERFARSRQLCQRGRNGDIFLFKQGFVHQHAIGSGENRRQQHAASCIMVDQSGADAAEIQVQGGIGKRLHMRDYRIVFFASGHPGIGEKDVGSVIAFQHRSQRIAVVVQLHIAELHIRIVFIEPVKFRLKRLKVVIASGHRDAAACACVERRFESRDRLLLRFAAAGSQ